MTDFRHLPAPATTPRVVLATATYNGRHLLEALLPSVAAQRFREFRVVVVDDASTDGTADWLAAAWPEAELIALQSNVGVTAAFNVCVRAAQGAEFLALVNNDVELEPDWLGTLVGVLETHRDAAAASGKLLRPDERGVIDRAGDQLHWSSACFGRGAGERDRGQYDDAAEVFSVGGAAALYRMDAFQRVGPFDEDFFTYLEDVDWGFRARLAGYGARYEPRALGLHHGSATLGDDRPFSLYHLRRNQIWLVAKNYPAASLLRHGHAVLALNLLQLALAVRPRRVALVLRAYRDALRGLPRVLVKRRAIQRGRAVGHAELARHVDAR